MISSITNNKKNQPTKQKKIQKNPKQTAQVPKKPPAKHS